MPPRSKQQTAITATRENDETDLPGWARGSSDGQTLTEGDRSESDRGEDIDPSIVGGPIEGEPVAGQVVSATPALDNLLEWLVNNVEDNDPDSLDGLEGIVRDVLTANDIAEVLRARLPQDASQWLGVPLLWEGFTIRESDYDEGKGLPFYVSMRVKCGEPAEARVINCGGTKVLAQTKRFAELGVWPLIVMIVETAKAKKGKRAPLGLVAIPE